MRAKNIVWTQGMDDRLRFLIDQKMDRQDIANDMGLTLWQVRGRARALGLVKEGTDAQIKARQTMRLFSDEDLASIRELSTAGHTPKQIAERLNRSPSTILAILYSLGLKTPKFKNPKQHWTETEDDTLTALYLKGMSSHTTAKALPTKSVAAVQKRAKKRRAEGTLPPTLHEWVSNRYPEILFGYLDHANKLPKPLNVSFSRERTDAGIPSAKLKKRHDTDEARHPI